MIQFIIFKIIISNPVFVWLYILPEIMNTDIEDFIKTKNAMGADDYNNFDVSMWDVEVVKKYLKICYCGFMKMLMICM